MAVLGEDLGKLVGALSLGKKCLSSSGFLAALPLQHLASRMPFLSSFLSHLSAHRELSCFNTLKYTHPSYIPICFKLPFHGP